jgi:hypothetical protein
VGERSSHPPGTFCWTDLSTSDQPAAKEFYCALFGWQAEDMPAGGDALYTMMRLRGRDVAAISAQPAQQRDAGVPPMWNSYVSVASADASAERVRELGGEVHAPPFDVLEAGRMAVIQDPQGAFFELWEPRMHLGAGLVNEPGALVWNELSSPDIDASAAFYGALFDWSTEPFEGMRGRYLTVKNAQHSAAGIRELIPAHVPPHWLVYFGAEGIAAALARVTELGGRAIEGPVQTPVGDVGFAADLQGAVFGLYAGELDP